MSESPDSVAPENESSEDVSHSEKTVDYTSEYVSERPFRLVSADYYGVTCPECDTSFEKENRIASTCPNCGVRVEVNR